MHELKQQIMELCAPLLDWFSSLGEVGLFILAFIEASFFPIPPDFLYIALIYKGATNPYFLALIATIGSVLGALFGYSLGLFGGRPIARKILGKNSDILFDKADKFFESYGSLAILIAAFTPIPFKVFTIASGMSRMKLLGFIFYCFVGRASRFFAVTFLLVNFGEAILQHFFKLSLIVIAIALAVYFTIRFFKKSNQIN